MVEQTIIQAALTSIETFNGIKSKFKAWMEAIENVAQISGQNAMPIAFAKLIGSPLLTANRLRTRLPNLTWANLKKELLMQYSIIPLDIHTTKVSPI